MLAVADSGGLDIFIQQLINGLTTGTLFALIAIGYTMVYGIIELINFAHGDLFMLGSFLGLTIVTKLALVTAGGLGVVAGVLLTFLVCMIFCASLNFTVDRLVYKPLRNAPKLTPLVSAIGVSFAFMGIGQLWKGVADIDFPNVIRNENLLPRNVGLGVELDGVGVRTAGGGLHPGDRVADVGGTAVDANTIARVVRELPTDKDVVIAVMREGARVETTVRPQDLRRIRFTRKDLMVLLVTVPLMIGLTLFVKYTKLGKAMRATAQNPVAARLMGIDVDRVIGATFVIGGALAGAASVIYGLSINTVSFQMGYQNGLYAFTAAVLGGIGNLPGAMLGGIIIGLVRSLGSQYVGEQWTSSLVFAILIVILVFRPSGLLGARTREKV